MKPCNVAQDNLAKKRWLAIQEPVKEEEQVRVEERKNCNY
jgi:hypothetical protein